MMPMKQGGFIIAGVGAALLVLRYAVLGPSGEPSHWVRFVGLMFLTTGIALVARASDGKS
jgi:multidrug transporter EmrE-like cation transporter